ncbi:ABC transporter substrate-binding protein [Wenzhouxiangella sp. XN201]|uniref:MlaC/ttg2D family ABC transporter substrate-binding protein n=1 Tax=Wenzhouxiangella sp. XN201 TaxID=2710755 RepID=UPI0013DBD960|nr:ABC transporter substrate-binding protein [Wenzhouxiangella sp. XN201]
MMRTLLLVLTMLIASPLLAETDPVKVIESTNAELAALINENRERYREDAPSLRQDIKNVLMPTIDTVYSARLVLGRHGRGRERSEIEAFAEALANQLLDRYATALLDYNLLERVEILPLTGDNTERATRVRTRVQLDNGDRAPVDYVLRQTDEGWKVFDVIVEGISYVATFRSQIDQEIRQTSFESLLERLEAGQYQVEVDD